AGDDTDAGSGPGDRADRLDSTRDRRGFGGGLTHQGFNRAGDVLDGEPHTKRAGHASHALDRIDFTPACHDLLAKRTVAGRDAVRAVHVKRGRVEDLEGANGQVPDLEVEPRVAGGDGVVEVEGYEAGHDGSWSLCSTHGVSICPVYYPISDNRLTDNRDLTPGGRECEQKKR